jgi:hypothetical protein
MRLFQAMRFAPTAWGLYTSLTFPCALLTIAEHRSRQIADVKTTLHRPTPRTRFAPRKNQSALALVTILLGGAYCLSGVLQHVPVFAAIAASVTRARPLLSAGQTVLLGIGLLVAGSVALAHPANRGPRH